MAEDEQIVKGLFNEAGFVIRRLDKLQTRINSVRANLLAYNIEQGCYNYEILYSDLTSLLNEIWAKLTDDEQTELIKVKDLVRDSLRFMPPHKSVATASANGKKVILMQKNWDKLMIFLDLFERLIKNAEDAHGFSNPDMEGNDLF